MLVARRKLENVFGQTILPGDPIPSPERWDRLSLQSHINIGWIEDAPASEETIGETKASPTDRSEDVGAFSCAECNREFDSQRALSVHKSRHK